MLPTNSTRVDLLCQIERIRNQIHQAHANEGLSLTSPKMLTLSRTLDRLINLYLNRAQVTGGRPT